MGESDDGLVLCGDGVEFASLALLFRPVVFFDELLPVVDLELLLVFLVGVRLGVPCQDRFFVFPSFILYSLISLGTRGT